MMYAQWLSYGVMGQVSGALYSACLRHFSLMELLVTSENQVSFQLNVHSSEY